MKQKLNMIVLGLFILFAVVIIANVFQISVVESEKYQAMADSNQFDSTIVKANRGSIYDTNGKILAQSATVYSIIINPKRFSELDHETIDPETGVTEYKRQLTETIKILTEELDNVTEENILKKLENTNTQWASIAKYIEKPVADKILTRSSEADLEYDLIYTEIDTKRYYPQGEFAASVIGFTDYEGDGIYGIESYYNNYLKGVDGKIISAKDAQGNEMPYKNDKVYDAKDGNSVYLTIDMTLQYYAEKYLEQAVVEHEVENRACAIIMDAKTGAILAMTTTYGYDLNDRNSLFSPNDIVTLSGIVDDKELYNQKYAELREQQWKNKAITELYFPGSVFKVITGAAALEEGTSTLNSTYNCSGSITVADTQMHCWASYSHGLQDFTTAMTNSCNPAFIQIGQNLGASKFSDYFEAFGFTEPTGIDLPGESGSLFVPRENMGPVELASCSFGQSNKITPLQMITAYAAVVNGGNLLTPYVVEKIVDTNGNVIKTTEPSVKRQVISEETSAEMRQVLESVVNNKNGSNAYIKGYDIGGKSGTSQKIDKSNETGNDDLYVSSYCGFAPADDPEIIMLVMVDEPTAGDQNGTLMYYGSVVACPVVSNTFKEALPYLGHYPEYTETELAELGITIPDLTGQATDIAKATLEQIGLNCETVGNGTSITSQNPPAGGTLLKNGKIILYTDETLDTEYTEVPNVLGMSLSEANKAITNAGLNFMSQGASGSVGAIAYTQNYEEGYKAPRGTIVDVVFIIKSEG